MRRLPGDVRQSPNLQRRCRQSPLCGRGAAHQGALRTWAWHTTELARDYSPRIPRRNVNQNGVWIKVPCRFERIPATVDAIREARPRELIRGQSSAAETTLMAQAFQEAVRDV